MYSYKQTRNAIVVFFVAALALPGLASSQESSSSTVLEEVMVTAQKRAESLQDVPVAVSVLSSETIEQASLSNFSDIAKLMPGFTYQDRNDQRTATFSIRGVGSPQTATGAEPSSAILIDGEVLARSTAIHLDLADAERVEVLKGPQGTLFGKNSSAGLLHIISQRPQVGSAFGNLDFTVAEDQDFTVKGSYNSDVGESTAWRVNALYRDQQGWIENIRADQPNGGERQSLGIRSQLLHEFGDDSYVLWRLDYMEQDYGPGVRVWISLDRPDDQVHQVSQTPWGPENDRTSQLGSRDYGGLENFGTSVEFSRPVGDLQFTYHGYYRDFDLVTNEDQGAVAVNFAPTYFAGPTQSKTTQHELRLESPVGEKFDYVLGAFVFYHDSFRAEIAEQCFDSGLNASTIDSVTFEVLDCPGDRLGGPDRPFFTVGVDSTTVETRNYALYGQANWHLSERVNLVTGLRALREEQDFDITNTIHPARTFGTYVNDSSESEVIGKLALQFFSSDDVMTYVSVSTGYKGVAWFNTPGFTNFDAANDTYPTDPETSTLYELGLRSTLADGRVQLNVTAFHTKYEGFQDRVFFTEGGAVVFRRLINAGDVISQGIETEFTALLSESFQLSGSIAYLDATFDSDIFGGCPPPFQGTSECAPIPGTTGPARLNLNGRNLANAPELQVNLSGIYEFDMGSGWEGFVRGDYRWKDDELHSQDQDPRTIQESYGIADLSVGFRSPERKYELTAFIKNVFDEHYYSYISNAGDGFSQTVISNNSIGGSVPRDHERYVGARFSLNF